MTDNPKVARVTGAAQGIGRGIAHYLLEKHWRVVLFDIDEAAGQQCLAQLPEGRAEDIGSLVAYLASLEASFVTGQDFIVDGGMTKKMIYG